MSSCDLDLAIRFLTSKLHDKKMTEKLATCKNPVFLLFKAVLDLAEDYALDQEIDYYLLKSFRFIYDYKEKLNLTTNFADVLDYLNQYPEFKDVAMSMIVALVDSGVPSLNSFLKNIPYTHLKTLREKARDFLSSISKEIIKPEKKFEDFYDNVNGYISCFIKLGIPDNIIKRYLNILIRLAVKSVYEFLSHIYWESKAWNRLYEEGTKGVYERLLLGNGLDYFANAVLDSEILDEDKVVIAEALKDYIEETDLDSFPFIKLLTLKVRMGILRNEELIIVYYLSRGILGWKDYFLNTSDIQEVIRYIARNLSGPEAALAITNIANSSQKPLASVFRTILDDEDIDLWTKITFSLTFLILIAPARSIDIAADPINYLYKLYSGDKRREKIIIEILGKKTSTDTFTKQLMKLMNHKMKIISNRDYFDFLFRVIPESMFGVTPPSHINLDEIISRCALIIHSTSIKFFGPPKQLIQQAIIFSLRNIKGKENLEKFINALEKTMQSSHRMEENLTTLINTIKHELNILGRSKAIQIIQKYMNHRKYLVRGTALRALYDITKNKKFLEIALGDRAKSIREWAKKKLEEEKRE